MPISLLSLLQKHYPETPRKVLYAAIVAGQVSIDGVKERRSALMLSKKVKVHWQQELPLASRAGLKLRAALQNWSLAVAGLVVFDAGAGRGGFSDCLLRRGAQHIYAVDCGKGQLDIRLQRHPRVTSCERKRLQDFSYAGVRADCWVADLSFRSLAGVLRKLMQLSNYGWGVALFKPQFEAPHLNRNGVVAPIHHPTILKRAWQDFLALGVNIDACLSSPLSGRKGNQEYLLLLRAQGATSPLSYHIRHQHSVFLQIYPQQ